MQKYLPQLTVIKAQCKILFHSELTNASNLLISDGTSFNPFFDVGQVINLILEIIQHRVLIRKIHTQPLAHAVKHIGSNDVSPCKLKTKQSIMKHSKNYIKAVKAIVKNSCISGAFSYLYYHIGNCVPHFQQNDCLHSSPIA